MLFTLRKAAANKAMMSIIQITIQPSHRLLPYITMWQRQEQKTSNFAVETVEM